jgi:N-acetylmuramic acid 6-phosphate etherase
LIEVERMELERLLTEQRNPASAAIDQAPVAEMLAIINEEDAKVAGAVRAEIPNIAKAVDAVTAAFERGGRLFYIGAGTSGRLGVLDASECTPTFNVPPSQVQGIIAGGEAALARAAEASEDDPAAGVRDLTARGFTGSDVLVGIAASGRTPYVLGAVLEARRLGAVTVGISCTPRSELAAAVDIAITPLCGPEVVTGSTRMKAGTATKLVLNMLTTGSMIRSGHVYGNLMVNVQPRNEKLLDRARRIVRDAAGVTDGEAALMLERSGNVVKTAILMARTGLEKKAAEDLLAQSRGRISEALKTTNGQICH